MNKLIIAAAVLMLTACTKETNNDRVAVEFSGSVGVIQTKAVDQEWSSNDAIGIFMVKEGETFTTENIRERAVNIRYVVDAARTGGFKAEGSTIYYPMNGDQVDFYAYYPQGTVTNNAISGNYEYALNVANQDNQEALDFMYSNNVKGKDKVNKDVALSFAHKLCKVVITVENGAGVSIGEMSGLTVKVNNQNTTATFDLTAGIIITGASTSDLITLYKQAGAYVYEAILLPSAETSRIFEFNLDNGVDEPFTWNMNRALAGGSKYTYTVKLNRSGIVVTGTIDAWNTEDGGTVDAY